MHVQPVHLRTSRINPCVCVCVRAARHCTTFGRSVGRGPRPAGRHGRLAAGGVGRLLLGAGRCGGCWRSRARCRPWRRPGAMSRNAPRLPGSAAGHRRSNGPRRRHFLRRPHGLRPRLPCLLRPWPQGLRGPNGHGLRRPHGLQQHYPDPMGLRRPHDRPAAPWRPATWPSG